MPRQSSFPVILIDNREQLKYNFTDYTYKVGTKFYPIKTMNTTIHTGDYSVAIQKGSELIRYDNEISIERKTLDNFVGDISFKENRERFENSVIRGSKMRYYCILIEGSEFEIMDHRYMGEIHPNSVLGTIHGWSVKHRVPIELVGNRFNAEDTTFQRLMAFVRYKKEGKL